MAQQVNSNQPFMQFEEEEAFDIKGFLFRLLSIWKWILLSLLLCIFSAYLINRYTTPLYLVKGSVLIDEDQQDMGAVIMEEMDMFTNKVNIENEIAILKSYSLSRAVVDSLRLYISIWQEGNIRDAELFSEEAPFRVKLFTPPGELKQVGFQIEPVGDTKFKLRSFNGSISKEEQTFSFGERISVKGLEFELARANQEEPFEGVHRVVFDLPEAAAKNLQKQLSIAALNRDASIVEISIEAANQTKAQAIIQTLMNAYISRELDLKNETAVKTISFIDQQLAGIQDALYTAESQLENFRSDNKILDISQEGMAVYTRLQELEKEAANTDLQLSYYNYLLEYLHTEEVSGSIVSPSTAGVPDQVLNSLVLQLNELGNQLIMVESSASEINPQVKLIKSQIASLLKKIRENVRNLKRTTEIQKEDLALQIGNLERELNSLPASERKLLNIQRRFNLNDNLYVYLQEKKAESGIAKASAVASTKVIDPPLVYEQTQPKILRNYILSLVLGLLLPMAFIFIKDYFTITIQSVQEVEKKISLPVLATIPLSRHETELVMAEKPHSMVAEGYRVMRSSLQYLSEKPFQTLMVTSFGSGDGKTFNSINIATMLAKTGKKTVLLGLDMRKPKIFDTFGVSNDLGISNVLIETHKLEDVMHETTIPNLHFISSGPVPPNPNELLLRQSFVQMIAELKERFDYLVIDSPPIGLVSDGLEMAKYADSVLFVVRHQKTPKQALSYLEDVTGKKLLQSLGLIYNGMDFEKMGRYGYGYGYGYGHGYYDEDKTLKSE